MTLDSELAQLEEESQRLRSTGRAKDWLPPLTAEQLEDLERKCGVRFPPGLTGILQRVTAGVPYRFGPLDELAKEFPSARPQAEFPFAEDRVELACKAALAGPGTYRGLRGRKILDGVLPIAIEGPGVIVAVVLRGHQQDRLWFGLDGRWIPFMRPGGQPVQATIVDLIRGLTDQGAHERPDGEPSVPGVLQLSGRFDGRVPDGFLSSHAGAVELWLTGNGLVTLPDDLRKVVGLRKLVLNGNPLTELPSSVTTLRRLEVLSIADAHLASLPDSVGDLCALRELALARNRLRDLPAGIGRLLALELLDVSSNPLATVPDAIGELANLRTLLLSRTAIRTLPPFTRATKMERIDLSHSAIKTLPSLAGMALGELVLDHATDLDPHAAASRIAGLHSLRTLRMGWLPLRTLPEVLEPLRTVEQLALPRAELASLPDWLERWDALCELDLRGNRFERVPSLVERLPSLRRLLLGGNPIPEADLRAARAVMPAVEIVGSA